MDTTGSLFVGLLFGLGAMLSVLVFGLYEVVYLTQLTSWMKRIEEIRSRILSLKSEELTEVTGPGASESGMITMGSIFIAASGVLITAAVTVTNLSPARSVIAFSAPLLFGWWLFSVQLTTRIIMDVKNEIELFHEHPEASIPHPDPCAEKDAPAHIRRSLYGGRNGRGWIMRVRRNHWFIPLGAFLIVAIFASSA